MRITLLVSDDGYGYLYGHGYMENVYLDPGWARTTLLISDDV